MKRLPESFRDHWRAGVLAALALALIVCANGATVAAQGDRRRQSQLDEALRREGEALVRIADDASRGRPVPLDFALDWRNDFFKAQPGTFVPFTITYDASGLTHARALLYVRAERSGAPAADPRGRSRSSFAYETIFPVTVESVSGQPSVLRRGFAVPPGRYRVTVVLREAPDDPRETEPDGRRKASVLTRTLEVPDFWTGELATSTIMLADRLEPLKEPVPADELDEHPYVVGAHRIHPSRSHSFGQKSELIVVFLVYNPTIGPGNHFDVQVDYHLYRKDHGGVSPSAGAGDHPAPRAGEQYVTRTNPQRFNPALMGNRFDAASAPVLAGQGILLSSFEPGEYRLGITVTDLLSRKTLTRDVAFAVIGS